MIRENQLVVDGIDNYRKRLDSETELVYIDGKWYFRNVIDVPNYSREMMKIQSEKFRQSNQNRKIQSEE